MKESCCELFFFIEKQKNSFISYILKKMIEKPVEMLLPKI